MFIQLAAAGVRSTPEWHPSNIYYFRNSLEMKKIALSTVNFVKTTSICSIQQKFEVLF